MDINSQENNEKPSQPLFRPEALASSGHQWLGSLRIAQPISAPILTGVALLISLAIVVFVCTASFTKRSKAVGVTVPVSGSISVAAPAAGVLSRRLAMEGEWVQKGQLIYEISTERQGANGELTAVVENQLNSRAASIGNEISARKVQYQERRTTIKNRFRSIQQEQEHLEEEIEINQRRLALVKATLEQYQKLGAEGYLSTAQVQAKQDESLDMAAKLSALKRARQQLAENKEAAQAELTALSLSEVSDLSLLERTSASLEQEKAENRNRRSVQIVAPQSGRLAVLLVQEGQTVIAGQPLASLIPVGNCSSRPGAEACSDNKAESAPAPADRAVLEANLYIPSRSAGFVEKGQSVMIRYHAFPYQKYGLHRGEIVDVSSVPLTPSDIPQAQATTIWGLVQQLDPAGAQASALYKVRVRLNEQAISTAKGDTALKAGLTLEADITLDERKVWEWVLEPMLAVSRRRAS